MPFKVKKVKGGYKVMSPKGPKSKKPLTIRRARQQQKAIYANWDGEGEDPGKEEEDDL
mgnify:CR=1 FL=1